MKSFQDILNANVIKASALEKFRISQLKRKRKILVLSIIVFVLTALLLAAFVYFTQMLWLAPTLLFALTIFLLVWNLSIKKKYNYLVKDSIINSLFKAIDTNFTYHPESYVSQQQFKESKFVVRFRNLTGEDFIIYNSETLYFEISDVKATDRVGNTNIEYFKGPFIYIKSPVTFSSTTTVVPDNLERKLGSFGRVFQSVNIFRDKLVNTNHQAFEEQFAVYGTNPDESKKVLSEALINYLLFLREFRKQEVYFTCTNNKIFIGFTGDNSDILKVDINNPVNDAFLENYYNEIVKYKQMVEKFTELISIGFESDTPKIKPKIIKAKVSVNK